MENKIPTPLLFIAPNYSCQTWKKCDWCKTVKNLCYLFWYYCQFAEGDWDVCCHSTRLVSWLEVIICWITTVKACAGKKYGHKSRDFQRILQMGVSKSWEDIDCGYWQWASVMNSMCPTTCYCSEYNLKSISAHCRYSAITLSECSIALFTPAILSRKM